MKMKNQNLKPKLLKGTFMAISKYLGEKYCTFLAAVCTTRTVKNIVETYEQKVLQKGKYAIAKKNLLEGETQIYIEHSSQILLLPNSEMERCLTDLNNTAKDYGFNSPKTSNPTQEMIFKEKQAFISLVKTLEEEMGMSLKDIFDESSIERFIEYFQDYFSK
jgi:hypothetical protein